MRYILLSCLLFLFTTCTPSDSEPKVLPATLKVVTITASPAVDLHDVRDSIALLKIDTSTPEGKRQAILRKLTLHYSFAMSECSDTLFDLNFDRHADLVVRHYGTMGTGLKNFIDVYLYDPQSEQYIFDQQLSDLRNPSFYLEKKKITEFYIGYGAGDGNELEWINGKWITTRTISVFNNAENTLWMITDPRGSDTAQIALPFQMVPPRKVLRNTFGS
jgi:hypothetical protein